MRKLTPKQLEEARTYPNDTFVGWFHYLIDNFCISGATATEVDNVCTTSNGSIKTAPQRYYEEIQKSEYYKNQN